MFLPPCLVVRVQSYSSLTPCPLVLFGDRDNNPNPVNVVKVVKRVAKGINMAGSGSQSVDSTYVYLFVLKQYSKHPQSSTLSFIIEYISSLRCTSGL